MSPYNILYSFIDSKQELAIVHKQKICFYPYDRLVTTIKPTCYKMYKTVNSFTVGTNRKDL